MGSITSWACEKYLRPFGAPDFFDDAGADHHLFARVLDSAGRPILRNNLIRYWSDGFEKLGDPGYTGYVHATPKHQSGWANQPMFNSFNPDRGERGAWCWCPEGASDVVVGGGMPNNQHVSFFAVWQEQTRQAAEVRKAPDTRVDESPSVPDLEAMRRQVVQRVWRLLRPRFRVCQPCAHAQPGRAADRRIRCRTVPRARFRQWHRLRAVRPVGAHGSFGLVGSRRIG